MRLNSFLFSSSFSNVQVGSIVPNGKFWFHTYSLEDLKTIAAEKTDVIFRSSSPGDDGASFIFYSSLIWCLSAVFLLFIVCSYFRSCVHYLEEGPGTYSLAKWLYVDGVLSGVHIEVKSRFAPAPQIMEVKF
jgi:hypothetical protein